MITTPQQLTVGELADDLLSHLIKEETILFPAILRLVALTETETPAENFQFVTFALDNMMKEHSASGEGLELLRRLTDDYTPPANACNSYRYLYGKLKEFDQDLRQHNHLENNILFPRTLALLHS